VTLGQTVPIHVQGHLQLDGGRLGGGKAERSPRYMPTGDGSGLLGLVALVGLLGSSDEFAAMCPGPTSWLENAGCWFVGETTGDDLSEHPISTNAILATSDSTKHNVFITLPFRFS
jgi:hypothetical protein